MSQHFYYIYVYKNCCDTLLSREAESVIMSGVPTALLTSNSNEWYTPRVYLEAARATMGGIDLDPASNASANQLVKASIYYDQDSNGFDKPWSGRVWLNPPYGKDNGESNARRWSARLIEQYQAGITTEAILLVNAVTSEKWFQPLWNYPICFTNHRIRFYRPDGTANQPTHGNAFVYFGQNLDRFYKNFSQFGKVVEAIGK